MPAIIREDERFADSSAFSVLPMPHSLLLQTGYILMYIPHISTTPENLGSTPAAKLELGNAYITICIQKDFGQNGAR